MAEQKPLIALGTHPNYEGLSELPDGDTLEGVVNLSTFGNHSIVRSDGAGDVSALAVGTYSVLSRSSGDLISTLINTNSFLGRGGTPTSPVTSISVVPQSVVGRTSSALSTLISDTNSYLGRGTGDLDFVAVPETTILGRNTGGTFQPLDIGTVQTMLGISAGQVPTALGSLSDVTLQAPAPGEALVYTSNNGGQWENLALTVPDVLDDNSGVGLGAGDEGTVVYFDGTDWVAQLLTISDISNVTTGGTISDSSVLWYENGVNEWQDRVLNLTLLNDVSSVSETDFHVLTFSGTTWTSRFVNFNFLETILGFVDGGAGAVNDTFTIGDVLVYTSVADDPNADDGDYWVAQPNTIANLLDVTVAAPYAGPDTEVLSRSVAGNWLVQNIDFSFLNQLEAGPAVDGETVVRNGASWDYIPLSLVSLGDTSVAGAVDGQFLTYDTSVGGGTWVAETVDLGFNADLDLDGPALGDILYFSDTGGTNRWRDVPLTLGLLADVIPNDIVQGVDQVLVSRSDGSGGFEWVNRAINLLFLSKVDSGANSATANHILRANGTSWLSVEHTLDAINNVSVPAPTNGQVLTYNFGSGNWVANTPTVGATNIGELSDVTTNVDGAGGNNEEGYTLRYNNTSGIWNGGYLQFSDLEDVNNVASVPSDGNLYYLYYNVSGDGAWDYDTISLVDLHDMVDTTPVGGEMLIYQEADIGQGLEEGWIFRALTANDIVYSLNDLTGVTVNSVTADDVLVFNGSAWVNDPLELNQLSDVDTTGVTAGQVLTFNGDWSPSRNKAVLIISAEQSAGFTAAVDTLYPVDCSSAAISILPPAGPSIGDKIAFSDSRANSSNNNITIDFISQSQLLHGQNDTFIMSVDADYVEFTYLNVTVGWIITS